MLREGHAAPDFCLPCIRPGHGDEPAWVEDRLALADLRGRHALLYFYPRDATPGCSTEASDFRHAYPQLQAQSVQVVGVSRDSLRSHQRFAAKLELPFPLLSDPDAAMIQAYGAWGEKKLYGKTSLGILRSTVWLDPEGRVHKHYPKVRVKGHVAQLLADVAQVVGLEGTR
ncbi:MAG: peroxiredoxin [Polyangiales bacterium]